MAVRLYVLLAENAGQAARRMAVEAAHLAGWASVSMTFPVVRRPGDALEADARGIPVDDDTALPALWRQIEPFAPAGVERPADYMSATESAPQPPAPPPKGGLECLFEPGWLLEDTDGDMLPDRVNARLLLPEAMDDALCRAACDFAARLGLESCGARLPIVTTTDDGVSNLIAFRGGDAPSVRLEAEAPRRVVAVHGGGERLAAFAADFCRRFPRVDALYGVYDAARHLEDAFAMRCADGQAAWLECRPEARGALLSPDADLSAFRARWPGKDLHRYVDDLPEPVVRFELPWELDAVRDAMEPVYAVVSRGDRISVRGALWQDRPTRRGLAEEIAGRLAALGAIGDVRFLCAYKQGLSWLEEDFAPAAASIGGARRVVVRYRPALPGQADGEMKPPRTLMDLYPSDALIAPLLGLSEDDIAFEPDDALSTTYRAVALDGAGRALLEDSYDLRVNPRPWLADYPEAGVSYPAAGWLRVWINGVARPEVPVATDADAVWDCWQARVLPMLRRRLDALPGDDPGAAPLFSHFDVEIGIGGPERQLSGNDLISAGECLHENLHYAAQAWLGRYACQRWGRRASGLGRVVPVIHTRPGRPELSVRLYLTRGKASSVPGTAVEARCTAVEEDMTLRFEAAGAPTDLTGALMALTAQGFTALARRLQGYPAMSLNGVRAVIPDLRPARNLTAEDVDWHENRLIGFDACMDMAQRLSRVPGLSVIQAGRSFQGRPIYALMPETEQPGWVTSRTKRILTRPTFLINGRHHANEVSASNAIFALARRLLIDPALREAAERVNLILLPMENVDSAARHDELQREHPAWQLHCCYENAVGADLIPEYFRHDTRHTGALALTRLAERWLPDALSDLHGVPHHETPVQFSPLAGYKGLWIPRAMLYGFYFHVDDRRFASNKAYNRAWAEAVAGAYADWTAFSEANRRMEKRFMKYAWNGVDESFPFDWEGGFLNYWPGHPHDPAHPYLSVSRPWLLSVLFTAEAADETARGEWLAACGEAHLRHLLAGIGLLGRSGTVIECQACWDGSGLSVHCKRHRPLLPPEERN